LAVFADFVFQQRGDAAIWLDPACVDHSFIDSLTDADRLFDESNCQITKDQRKIKVGRVTLPIAGRSRTIFVKRYNAFSWRYKLASPFIQSGAFRSLRGAAILRAAHIPTALPVAAVENRRGGALTKSFFLSEEIAGGETADAYWRGRLLGVAGREGARLRRRFLAELAQLFRTLHSQRIYHNDLKDANILAAADRSETGLRLFLLDLDGVASLAQLSERRKVKNLVQINRTLGQYLRRSEKVFFLKSYLGSGFAERSLRRRLMENVMAESKRVDRLKARHD
jgi:tRNA A-37 threonylcarbamoyl transferase component Bud32